MQPLNRSDATITTLTRTPVRARDKIQAYVRRKRRLEVVLATAVPLALLLLWEVSAQHNWIDARFYPAPSTCFLAVREMLESGELGRAMLSTLYVVLYGFAVGSITAFAFGVVMGVSRWSRVALEPLLSAFYVIPKLAILPVFLTIFGLGAAPKVALCAVTVFFYVWIVTMEAIASVPNGYREAAASFGVSRWQMFWHVELPATLPQVFVSLRIGMGVAILVTIAAEFVVGSQGLGYLIFNARALFMLEQAYAGIVIVALLGIALSAIVSVIGRKLTPWERPSRRKGRWSFRMFTRAPRATIGVV